MTSIASSPPDGLILVLNNCEDRLQLVLGETSTGRAALLGSRELVVPGRTAAFLIPAVAELLNEQQRQPEALVAIACTRGPGSFTGIRLALSAAAGLAAGMATPALLSGLDYLPLVAAAPLALAQTMGMATLTVTVLTYARRGQVYLQGFQADGQPGTPLLSLPATEAAETLESLDRPMLLVGSGLHKNFEVFQPLAENEPENGVTLLGPRWSHPAPETLLAAAMQADYQPQVPEPAYGRAADAEDNLEAIAEKRGMDPREARRLFDKCRRS